MNILNKIWNEDCVGEGVGMSRIADKSVDMILADLPYGTTRNKWDSVIPIDKIWLNYERIIKPNGAVVLTAQTPFDKVIGASNIDLLRYEWIWEKTQATGHLNANKMPMKAHENILVFYKNLPTYNPIKTTGHERKVSTAHHKRNTSTGTNYGKCDNFSSYDSTERFPRSIIEFSSDKQVLNLHPTQKPVALFEYLVRTYTNEGDLVLDNCAGSFTTAVACENLNRNWICMEQDREYCKIGWKRIQENRLRLESLTQTL